MPDDPKDPPGEIEYFGLIPMTFHMSRGSCPYCGQEIRVTLEKAPTGTPAIVTKLPPKK